MTSQTASAIRARAWRAARGANVGGRPGPKPSAPCGTVSAYKRHARNNETVCDACREVWNMAQRARRAANK